MSLQQTLLNSLTDFFKSYPNIERQNSYAVAVSGGPDSIALFDILFHYTQSHQKKLHVLTVDHGLRAESKSEAMDVGAWVESKKSDYLVHHILSWNGDKPEAAIMEAARHARYDLMAQYCNMQKIQTLFLAHHQDDQAETFLIRLAKGSGLDGLAAMDDTQIYADNLTMARPFLNTPKNDLVSYCLENKIKFVQDPSNENSKYLRPRLRQSMQVLSEEGLTAKRLSNLSRRLRRARNALENLTEKAYLDCLKETQDNQIVLDFLKLQNFEEEIAFRVLQKIVSQMRPKDDYGVRYERLEDLFESLMQNPLNFKPRTLGHLIFALKDKNKSLYIIKE